MSLRSIAPPPHILVHDLRISDAVNNALLKVFSVRMLTERTTSLCLPNPSHTSPHEAGMNNLFEESALRTLMKLPRIKPKIMGVPVSIETVRNLSRAGRDIAMMRYVPDDVKQTRLDICKECPSWKNYRCTECGCQMRVKASLTSSECPLKKWSRHVPSLNLGDAGIDTGEHEERSKQA